MPTNPAVEGPSHQSTPWSFEADGSNIHPSFRVNIIKLTPWARNTRTTSSAHYTQGIVFQEYGVTWESIWGRFRGCVKYKESWRDVHPIRKFVSDQHGRGTRAQPWLGRLEKSPGKGGFGHSAGKTKAGITAKLSPLFLPCSKNPKLHTRHHPPQEISTTTELAGSSTWAT